ncbi:MAG TPA: MBL fold metallo-hydrolase [Dehalococcoidia bacterium]|jgi:glyoxylase-like metal-dependent hydrolase (beta-lactamase superfamily II)|nr:MBL fold metallo-hydrolase [Dehalococcoidia bacterium]
MLIKRLVVGPFASNCYIVGTETSGEALVIDPGDQPDKILRAVEESKLACKLIVATHAHIDHISGVRKLKEATGARFALHQAEAAHLGHGSSLASMFGVYYDPPPQPDLWLDEGDVVELGELSFRVVHTPGHTPGGISLIGHGVVFSGDTLFNFGIGRTDFPGGSYEQLQDSIRTKLMVLPDDTVVLSGHGPQTTIGAERGANPWLR